MKAAGKIKIQCEPQNFYSITEQWFRGKISTKRSSGEKKNLKSPGILNKFTISTWEKIKMLLRMQEDAKQMYKYACSWKIQYS